MRSGCDSVTTPHAATPLPLTPLGPEKQKKAVWRELQKTAAILATVYFKTPLPQESD